MQCACLVRLYADNYRAYGRFHEISEFELGAKRVKEIASLQRKEVILTRVLFSLKRTNYLLALKKGKKDVNPCSGGLRKEDQGVQSPQTSGEEFFLPSTAAFSIGALSSEFFFFF